MVEMIIDTYDSFREEDFTATVTEMGIKTFGEKETLKAYIKFDDEGADITFFIQKSDGSEMLEAGDEPGHAKLKSFLDLGNFAKAAKKLGYETRIDLDPSHLVFKTVPDLVGKKTSWKAKKSGKKIDADGNEGKSYTNFLLVSIEGTSNAPKASTEKPKEVPQADLKPVWTQELKEILKEPLNEAGILKAINTKLPDDDKRKAMHKVRKATLLELVKEGTLDITEDGKYQLKA